jgi:lambda family phage portal protein
MNWLDQAIASVSPRMGLQRVRARAAMSHLHKISGEIEKLGYAASTPSRKSNGWVRPSTSANTEVGQALRQLRDGARSLERDNPLAQKACTEYEIKVVGTGITPQARTGNTELNKVLDDAFQQWAEQANADGQPGYFGLQGLGFRTIFRDGEALLRHRSRQQKDGPFVTVGGKIVSIPYQVQLLEPDFLDPLKTYPTQTGYVIQGVEFDKIGRRLGYWIFPQHPGDAGVMGLLNLGFTSNFIPASSVEHGRRIQRAGQIRGASSFAPVMVALHELDNYEQAEQTRKLIEACLTAFVYEPDDSGETLGNIVTNAQGDKVESFEPGMIAYVKGGKQVQLSEPKAAGGYAEYMRTRHRVIAAGLGIPYEILTNDYSQSNYSSSRMGLVSFKKICEYLQWSVAIPFVCTPVWNRFIDTCVVAGIVPANTPDLYSVEWAPPPFDLLDREAEALADIFELRIGKKTWAQLVGEQGQDPAKQAETIAHWNEVWDKLGITLDCDPRKAARTGVAQKAQEGNKTPPGSSLQHFEPREIEQLQHVPAQVNIAAPASPSVNVSSPEIHMAAPNVTVNAPPVTVNLTHPSPNGRKVQSIRRDENGRMVGIETMTIAADLTELRSVKTVQRDESGRIIGLLETNEETSN